MIHLILFYIRIETRVMNPSVKRSSRILQDYVFAQKNIAGGRRSRLRISTKHLEQIFLAGEENS